MRHSRAFALVLVLAFGSPATTSTVVRQVTFEEATRGSDVIVLGTVSEIPDVGVFHPKYGGVKHNIVRVKRYLKGGTGTDTVTVLTLGGRYVKPSGNGPEIHETIVSHQPTLPPEGSEVLLFLTDLGGVFSIHSYSHGVVRTRTTVEGRQYVHVRFGDPDVMPQEARRRYDADIAERGTLRPRKSYTSTIPVEELSLYVGRALDRDQ